MIITPIAVAVITILSVSCILVLFLTLKAMGAFEK